MRLNTIFILLAMMSSAVKSQQETNTIYDQDRDRSIPIELNQPINSADCTAKNQCPVAIISAGYGIKHHNYQFISSMLNQLGYLTLNVGHELKNDPPLSVTGNLYQTRSENWQRGANTLRFVTEHYDEQFSQYNFEKITLVGHSNGGDISAWFANENAPFVDTLITLDHRRVPLPRSSNIHVLSLRASDFPADNGVLYNSNESNQYPVCVLKINKARHNDIHDDGPNWLKQVISQTISHYLTTQSCTLKG